MKADKSKEKCYLVSLLASAAIAAGLLYHFSALAAMPQQSTQLTQTNFAPKCKSLQMGANQTTKATGLMRETTVPIFVMSTGSGTAAGLPECGAGFVPIGITTGSIGAANQYTQRETNGVAPFTTLRGESMIIDSTGWGFNKLYYADNIRNDNEQDAQEFHYRSNMSTPSTNNQSTNPINKVQLICAQRQVGFVPTNGPCNLGP